MWVESRDRRNRPNHDLEELRPYLALSRSITVLEDVQIVGGAHLHLMEMSKSVKTSVVTGVSNVELQPSDTRRAIMTQIMRHQQAPLHRAAQTLELPVVGGCSPMAPSFLVQRPDVTSKSSWRRHWRTP